MNNSIFFRPYYVIIIPILALYMPKIINVVVPIFCCIYLMVFCFNKKSFFSFWQRNALEFKKNATKLQYLFCILLALLALWGLFVVFYNFISAFKPNNFDGFSQYLTIIFLLPVFFLIKDNLHKIPDNRDLGEKIILYISYGMLISLSLFCIEVIFNGVFLRIFYYNKHYTMHGFNFFMVVHLLLLSMTLHFLFIFKHYRLSIILLGFSLISIYCFSNSETAKVMMIICLLMWLYRGLEGFIPFLQKRRNLIFLFLLCALFSTFLTFIYLSNIGQSRNQNYQFLTKSAVHRLCIWRDSLNIGMQNKIGHSFKGSRALEQELMQDCMGNIYADNQQFQKEIYAGQVNYLYPHNLLLQMLVEFGIVGLSLYILCIFVALLLIKIYNLQQLFIIYILVLFVTFSIWSDWFNMWFLCLYLLSQRLMQICSSKP